MEVADDDNGVLDVVNPNTTEKKDDIAVRILNVVVQI